MPPMGSEPKGVAAAGSLVSSPGSAVAHQLTVPAQRQGCWVCRLTLNRKAFRVSRSSATHRPHGTHSPPCVPHRGSPGCLHQTPNLLPELGGGGPFTLRSLLLPSCSCHPPGPPVGRASREPRACGWSPLTRTHPGPTTITASRWHHPLRPGALRPCPSVWSPLRKQGVTPPHKLQGFPSCPERPEWTLHHGHKALPCLSLRCHPGILTAPRLAPAPRPLRCPAHSCVSSSHPAVPARASPAGEASP